MPSFIRKVLIGTASALALGALVGVGTEAVIRSRVAHEHPAPGRLVDIGGRQMQIDCRGTGAPTVVFESGLDLLGSTSWAAVHDSIASTTRACAYSRAGILWSDRAPKPFTADGVATDLRATLSHAGETVPVVLVGHSIGGVYALQYTKRFGADVAGLVLVDASHPDQLRQMEAATGKSMAPTAGPLTVAASLARTGLVRLLAPDLNQPNAPAASRDAPGAYVPASLPAGVNELKAVPATLAAAESSRSLGERPLVVLTAAQPSSAQQLKEMALTAEQGDRLLAVWLRLQTDEATWSTNSRQEILKDASHYIQFDRPDAVIRAVRHVVGAVRQSAAGSREGLTPP